MNPAEIIAEASRAIHYFRPIPSGFDPLSASPQTLVEHGLPVRPSEPDGPDALAFWKAFFEERLTFVAPGKFVPIVPTELETGVLKALNVSGAAQRQRSTSRGRGAVENSANWSGLYLRSSPSRRFVEVNGMWRVPRPRIPDVPPIGPEPDTFQYDEFRSSAWVGFDGHRSYPNVSMPQCGTRHYVRDVGGTREVTIGAWWQWWQHKKVTPENQIPLPVGAGDEIMVKLTVFAKDEVRFLIKNRTKGLAYPPFLVQAPAGAEPIGGTAEWIVERPTWPTSLLPHKLPNFGEVAFSGCYATSATSPVAQQTTHRLNESRLIRMQERFDNPYRTALVSIPELLSETTARVRYREANGPWPVA